MSKFNNERLVEQANELLEEISSHPSGLDKALAKALKDNDLDEVHRLVTYLNSELAKTHFYNYNLLVF